MKRLLKVSAMTGLLTLLRMSMGFVIAKVVAIYTGPTGMAMLGQVQSMVTSLNGIINAPVGSGIVRFTAQYKEKGFDICSIWWRASLYWVALIASITIPIGIFLSSYIADWLLHDSTLAWVVIITVSVLPFSAIGTICNSIINGQQLYRRFVGLGILSTFISSGIMLTLIVTSNIKGALLAAAIQSAIIGIVMFIANLRQPWMKLRYWWGNQDHKARKSIAGYMLMALTTATTVPISLILIRNILIYKIGWDAAGYWQAVWKISEVYLGVITMALGTYYLPKLSALKSTDEIIIEIHKTAKIILPIVIMMSICVYLLRDVAIWLLFTEEFKPIRDLFFIQLCGDIVKIASWLYAYPMLARGTTKWFIFTEITFSFSFVIFSYFLVINLGLEGVTYAYLFNYIIYFLFIFFNINKIIR
ncbi:O-antigen translocase [Proteus mirabilis]|nr:O-antigen translocase [Proteus mirabilis]EKX9511553.1 O-antigen translocase [Proteus mirabilis]MBG2746270.1 O-antigen translocase [Proteus mirabilis]HEJ9682109.1 O-antigen translocase [Proteus mirabilis]HEJ9684786.1 O-antigen translocase [Proteus mirabilis]